MTLIQVRINQETKEEAKALCESMGLTLSGSIKMFLHQMIAQGEMPFTIKPGKVRKKTGIKKSKKLVEKTQKTEAKTEAKPIEKTPVSPTPNKQWSPFTQRKIG